MEQTRSHLTTAETDRGIGRFLRDAREQQGLAIDDLASRTRIPPRTLRLLESESWDLLPAEVFVRGFVRSCARELRLDPKEATDRLASRLMERRRPRTPPPVVVGDMAAVPGGSRRVRVALFVFIVIVIATITLSLLLGRGRPPAPGISVLPPRGAAPI